MHDSRKTTKNPFQSSDLWKQGEYNIVPLLTQKDTPHPRVPPVSYSPETGENIAILEAEWSKIIQKIQNQ